MYLSIVSDCLLQNKRNVFSNKQKMIHQSLLLLLGIAGLVHMYPVVHMYPYYEISAESDEIILKDLPAIALKISNIAKKLNAQNTARDCYDYFKAGFKKSGIYNLSVGKPLLCDMNGGWTVFQKRVDGSEDFSRDWSEYRTGFGDLEGEFWLGMDTLNNITSEKDYMLRVEVENFAGEKRYADYDKFTIGDEKQNYKLTLGTYSGNAGDALGQSSGQPFSTKDKDNNKRSDSCTATLKGAWWIKGCNESNLNGLYHNGKHTSDAQRVKWNAAIGNDYSVKSTVMKIKPI